MWGTVQQWISVKAVLQSWSGISNDALHVLLSVPALILLAALLRRPLWSLLPWAALLLLEILNEVATGLADGVIEDWEIRGSLRDVPLVMAVPTMLLLACRLAPKLVAPKKPAVDLVPIRYRERVEIIDAEFEEIR